MTDRPDDELDRRIRSTIGRARADAPAPPPFDSMPTIAPPSWGRWFAVAATLVLVAGAVVALVARAAERHPSTAPATTVPNGSEAATASTAQASSTTVPTLNCPTPHAAYYDIVGTMHTLVADTRDISVAITLETPVVCTEGGVATEVVFTNHGTTTEHLQYPQLILNGGMGKWVLAEFLPFDLAPGASHTERSAASLPAVQPRTYSLTVLDSNGYLKGNEVQLTVQGPDLPTFPPPTTLSPLAPVRCAASDLTATSAHSSAGTLGERTDVVLTNVSGRGCTYLSVESVAAFAADGSVQPFDLQPDETLGNPPELTDGVLAAGASVTVRFHWTQSCEPAVASRSVTVLRLTLPAQMGDVDVLVDPFDVACTVGIA